MVKYAEVVVALVAAQNYDIFWKGVEGGGVTVSRGSASGAN